MSKVGQTESLRYTGGKSEKAHIRPVAVFGLNFHFLLRDLGVKSPFRFRLTDKL